MLPSPPDQSEPVILPHLRSPSPPSMAPYPSPSPQHSSYTSFVLDKSTTHTYPSYLLDEMEQVTNNLIEGETVLRRALGRLWQVMNEDPPTASAEADRPVVPKQEDEGDGGEDGHQDRRLGSAPDLTPAIHKVFLNSFPEHAAPVFDPSQFAHPDMPIEITRTRVDSLRNRFLRPVTLSQRADGVTCCAYLEMDGDARLKVAQNPEGAFSDLTLKVFVLIAVSSAT